MTCNYKSNTLIYGCESNAVAIYKAILEDSSLNVIGFVNLNHSTFCEKLCNTPVYKLKSVDKEFVVKNNINTAIIAKLGVNSSYLLEIITTLLSLELVVKIVPKINKFKNEILKFDQIRKVEINDLFDNDSINFTNKELINYYDNQIILITGAAGSIGSKIAAKLLSFKYKNLILVDNSESSLYEIQQDFIQKGVSNFEVIVGDIRDKISMDSIFNKYRPNIVFHMAAYKHVPLMENNPFEALNVNAIGTKNIADISIQYNVDKFLFISTDKAVNPTSVMGASKRIAELYISCVKNISRTKFITTRFGNVLNTNGSVIPLFIKQINSNESLTVTHPNISRYFISINEVCHLILQSTSMGEGGEIFVFNMGKSLRIFDLAVTIIKLSGLNYPEDIDIKITGLRPGEKIHEELLTKRETANPTNHKKIMIVETNFSNLKSIKQKIDHILSLTPYTSSDMELVSQMKDLLPEYSSKNSIYKVLDD